MVSVQIGGDVYFYPRSPCGERLKDSASRSGFSNISIHALLAESDPDDWSGALLSSSFLSTLSLRRATLHRRKYRPVRQISIHALLAESDPTGTISSNSCCDFYPRSPCGERQSQSNTMP